MCDCNPPEAMTTLTRRARATHVCCECDAPIQRGEQYKYISGIWDGSALSFKTCMLCVGVRNYYVAKCLPPGDCAPCLGHFWNDATDHGNACTMADIIQDAAAAGYL